MSQQFTYFMTRNSMVSAVEFWGIIPVGEYLVTKGERVYVVMTRAHVIVYRGDADQVFEWLAVRVIEEDN